MLNLFCDKVSIGSPCGTSTPYTKLKELLNSKRYECIEEELNKSLFYNSYVGDNLGIISIKFEKIIY